MKSGRSFLFFRCSLNIPVASILTWASQSVWRCVSASVLPHSHHQRQWRWLRRMPGIKSIILPFWNAAFFWTTVCYGTIFNAWNIIYSLYEKWDTQLYKICSLLFLYNIFPVYSNIKQELLRHNWPFLSQAPLLLHLHPPRQLPSQRCLRSS